NNHYVPSFEEFPFRITRNMPNHTDCLRETSLSYSGIDVIDVLLVPISRDHKRRSTVQPCADDVIRIEKILDALLWIKAPQVRKSQFIAHVPAPNVSRN